jgi:hypothetical protein
MTALAASFNRLEKYDPAAFREEFPATDSTQYFKGSLVGVENTTGKLVKLTLATVVRSVWLCEEEVLTGVSTTELVKVRCGMHKFANGDTIVAADIGKLAFATDDNTVQKGGAPASECIVGVIEGIDGASAPGGAGVWVRLTGFNHAVIAATASTLASGG